VLSLNSKSLFSLIKNIWKLKIITYKYKPDLIIGWMYHGMFVSLILRFLTPCKKLIWLVRGSLDLSMTKVSTLVLAVVCGIFSNLINCRIIFNSICSYDNHIYLRYSKRKSKVIHNGVDTNLFDSTPRDRIYFRKKFNIPEKSILIGMFGRFDQHKDYKNLIEAVYIARNSLNDVKIILAGKNVDFTNEYLLNLIVRNNLEDTFILMGERTDIDSLYKLLDIFVLSSKSESCPNVLLEAMSSKVPCISTDVGDSKILLSEYGWVVPPNCSKELSHQLVDVLNKIGDVERWSKLSADCRAHVERNYSIGAMRNEYFMLFSEVI
jgi:glycosyltransferase involved in cell wall biosynthesis